MFSKNEQEEFLNADASSVLLRDLLGRLGLRGVVRVVSVGAGKSDAFVEVSGPSGATRTYAVEFEQVVPPALATALHRHDQHPLLVVAPSITERAAELLRMRGIDYLDEAGNAHIAWDGVLVDIRGRRGASGRTSVPTPRGGKAFGRAGLQVIFVLLSCPQLVAEPLRRLADASGVSLGTAKMVVDELSGGGYLYDAQGERRLGRAGELLSRWAEAYSMRLSPALVMGDFSVPDISWWQDSAEEFLGLGVQLGGEAGASLVDAQLVPVTLTLYADELPTRIIGRHRMVGAPHGDGNVHIRRRFWKSSAPSWVVPITLIYADLLASGDPRQREHADRIRSGDDRLAALDRL